MSFIVNSDVLVMDVPKRGTSSLIEAITRKRMPFVHLGQHLPVDCNTCKHAIVLHRHPAAWLRSLWCYRRSKAFNWRSEWHVEHELIECFGRERLQSFDFFCEAVTYREQWADDFDRSFTGAIRSDAHVVRTESLIDDFEAALRACGYADTFERLPAANVSRDVPDFPDGFEEALHALNRDLYHRMNYDVKVTGQIE